MKNPIIPALLVIAAIGGPGLPAAARAETRACTPVDSLPAKLSVSGVYCLQKDLATAATTGPAIRISGRDITLDCNGYKLGGLGGGAASQAVGIATEGARDAAVVRNCSVRGFRTGIHLVGDMARVEGNRLDGNLQQGIRVEGRWATIAGNRVFDTGTGGDSRGIVLSGSGRLAGNTVTGVEGAAIGGNGDAAGLVLGGAGPMLLEDNRVRGVVAAAPPAQASGLALSGAPVLSLRGNWFIGSMTGDAGVRCAQPITAARSGDTVAGFTTQHAGCGPDLP